MDKNKALDAFFKLDNSDAHGLELDRLLLRMFEDPALISHLNAVGKKGEYTELDFDTLPQEVIDSVKSLIGPINVEVLAYNVAGRPHTGFRFKVADLCPKK